MTRKNEAIYLFMIKESYSRGKVQQNFSTTASALEEIFGADFKTKLF